MFYNYLRDYDPMGSQFMVTDTRTLTYDDAGRLVTLDDARHDLGFDYDDLGRLTDFSAKNQKQMKREGRKSEMDFSRAVRDSFNKRSRALSRRGATVDCTPVKEIVNGKESRLNRTDVTISYRVSGAPVNMRLQVWADGWIWFDVRCTSKSGWVWEYTTEGRFVSDKGARGLVTRTEKSMDASHLESSKVAAEMEVIWSTCLATGPRTV